MNISVESYGHAVMLTVQGELTEDTLAAFRQAVDHQLADADVIDLILNLEEVPFLDSAALECLLALQDRLAERFGRVKLTNAGENVSKILEITRLDTAFERCEDVAEAVKNI